LPGDGATDPPRRLLQRATHHTSRSRMNTDQAALQIVTFGEAVASA
jgi:hypothetical protein